MAIRSSGTTHRYFLIHRWTYSLLLLACLTVGYRAHGETVEFQGGRFPVDRLTTQSNGDVLIEVGGHTWLAPSDKVGPTIAEVFVQDPRLGKSMPWSNYVDFLVLQMSSPILGGVGLAVQAVLSSDVFKAAEVELLAKRLASSAEGMEVLSRSVRAALSEGRYQPTAVCIASQQLSRQLRMAIGDEGIFPNTMRLSCGVLAVEVARQAFLSGEFATSEDVLRATLELYGAESNRESDLKVAADRIGNFSLASSGGDVGRYESAFQVLAADPLMRGAIVAATPGLVRRFAEKALERGDGASAIQVLLLLPIEQRSPFSHEIVTQALGVIDPRHSHLFTEPKIQQMMWAYANKDALIKDRYLDFLERAIEELGEEGDISQGSMLIANVRELRPDPSSSNDSLRFMLATLAAEQGKWKSAEGIMNGAKTKIPWSLKLSFFFRRHTFFLITPIILLLGLVFMRLERRKARQEPSRKRDPRQSSSGPGPSEDTVDPIRDDDDFEGQRIESLHRLSRSMHDGRSLEEYDRLLLAFGLKREANSHDIKQAYRQAVKSCHPDRNPNADKAMNDEFIEMTKQYERLLELYEARQRDSAS
jgi:DnaJ-domain-containing protein 1